MLPSSSLCLGVGGERDEDATVADGGGPLCIFLSGLTFPGEREQRRGTTRVGRR